MRLEYVEGVGVKYLDLFRDTVPSLCVAKRLRLRIS